MPTHDAPPIQSTDELLAVFRDAEKPPSQFRIGPEMEKHGLVGSERRFLLSRLPRMMLML
jgi:hypothetical protein